MDRATSIMNAKIVLLLYHRDDEHSLLINKRKLRLTRKQTFSNCLTITKLVGSISQYKHSHGKYTLVVGAKLYNKK